MARTPITSSFTPRTKPTTNFEVNRSGVDFLLQESLGKLLLETGGGILLESSLVSDFNTTRYAPYLQTIDLDFITDSEGVILEGVGISDLNILQSNWK